MKSVIFGLLLSVGAQAATSVDADTLYAREGLIIRMLFKQLIFIKLLLKVLDQTEI